MSYIYWPSLDRNYIREYLRSCHTHEIMGFISDSTECPAGGGTTILGPSLTLKAAINENAEIVLFGTPEQIANKVEKIESFTPGSSKYCLPFFLLHENKIKFKDLQYFPLEYIINIIRKIKQSKKIVVLNGNCQITYLTQILARHKEFKDKYFIIDIPRIFEFSKQLDSIKLAEVIKSADVILSQPIKSNNKFSSLLSCESLLSLKSDYTKFVLIPNITFAGYWPQMRPIDGCTYNPITLAGQKLFPYADFNIIKFLNDEVSDCDIMKEIRSIDFYSKSEVLENLENELITSTKREEGCDVKIFDFVKNNLFNRIMFYSFNHPKPFLIEELAKRIFVYFGFKSSAINDLDELRTQSQMHWQQQYIYPSVELAICATVTNESLYSNRYVNPVAMSAIEYLQTYINSLKISKAKFLKF